MMRNKLVRLYLFLIIFAVGMAEVHFLVFRILPAELRTPGMPGVHLFLFILTLFVFICMTLIHIKKPNYTGLGFIGMILIKMIISFIYLLPEILNKNAATRLFVIQFFILYFAYLAFEVVILLKLINRKDQQPQIPAKEIQ